MTARRPRIGVILTPDNANDADFARFAGDQASVHVTRLADWRAHFADHTASSAFAVQPTLVAAATSTLAIIGVDVTIFGCTSGSFLAGREGEREIRQVMLAAGARRALTPSGALLEVFAEMRARRVAVGTAYDEPCSRLLEAYLVAAGIEVLRLTWAPPPSVNDLADYQEEAVESLAERAHVAGADALFLSCAALPTADLLPTLSARLGVPTLSSTQVAMRVALARLGLQSV